MDNVLLLRSTNIDGPDKYESAFQAAGYHALSVPVLETVLVNQDDLLEVVRRGPQEAGLSVVVITSSRSAEAWREVVGGFIAQDLTASMYLPSSCTYHCQSSHGYNQTGRFYVLCSRAGYG